MAMLARAVPHVTHDPQVSAEDLLTFFANCGSISFVRIAGDEGQVHRLFCGGCVVGGVLLM